MVNEIERAGAVLIHGHRARLIRKIERVNGVADNTRLRQQAGRDLHGPWIAGICVLTIWIELSGARTAILTNGALGNRATEVPS